MLTLGRVLDTYLTYDFPKEPVGSSVHDLIQSLSLRVCSCISFFYLFILFLH